MAAANLRLLAAVATTTITNLEVLAEVASEAVALVTKLDILAEVGAEAAAGCLTKGSKTSMIKNDEIDRAAISLGLTPAHFVGLDCRDLRAILIEAGLCSTIVDRIVKKCRREHERVRMNTRRCIIRGNKKYAEEYK